MTSSTVHLMSSPELEPTASQLQCLNQLLLFHISNFHCALTSGGGGSALSVMFNWKVAFTLAINTLMSACATQTAIRHNTSESTRSPAGKYGITVPVYHFEDEPKNLDENAADEEVNKVVNLKTGRIVAIIEQDEPGYDRTLNHHGIGNTRWSSDSSLLLWKVGGKWFDDSLVLIKIKDDKAKWQLDLMKTGQHAILERTKRASPKEYAAFRKAYMDAKVAHQAKYPGDSGGSAYPEGFTIDVRLADDKSKPLTLPLRINVDLTSNPKGMEGEVEVDSYMDAVVTKDGKFTVTNFKLGVRPMKTGDSGPSWR